jgi:hypothetical protein
VSEVGALDARRLDAEVAVGVNADPVTGVVVIDGSVSGLVAAEEAPVDPARAA